MYYEDNIIQELIDRIDIIEVIGKYVNLTRKGSNYFGICPFHKEKTPSFSVSIDKKMFYCFGCGEGGNVINFIQKYKNLLFPEAIEYLAEMVGYELPTANLSAEEIAVINKKKKMYEINELACKWFENNIDLECDKYKEKRGLTKDVCQKFRIGYGGNNNNGLYKYLKSKNFSNEDIINSGVCINSKGYIFDRFFKRMVFPIFDTKDKVIAFSARSLNDEVMPKYMNSPETLIFTKGNQLFGMNFAKTVNSKNDKLILLEGNIDVISAHKNGFENSVASLGTGLTINQCKLIKSYFKEVIIIYDNDEAGIKATKKAFALFKSIGMKCKATQVRNAKDVDEFLNNYSKYDFERILDDAVGELTYLINNSYKENEEISKEILDLMRNYDDYLELDSCIKLISILYKVDIDNVKKMILIDFKNNDLEKCSKDCFNYNLIEKLTAKYLLENNKEILNIVPEFFEIEGFKTFFFNAKPIVKNNGYIVKFLINETKEISDLDFDFNVSSINVNKSDFELMISILKQRFLLTKMNKINFNDMLMILNIKEDELE